MACSNSCWIDTSVVEASSDVIQCSTLVCFQLDLVQREGGRERGGGEGRERKGDPDRSLLLVKGETGTTILTSTCT